VQRRLLSELRTILADYKLPRRSVVWSELPKNALGKVLKTQLREPQEGSAT
jgi:acyl-CoA synthetase (AMP-forming)/AMP-acid ligase II